MSFSSSPVATCCAAARFIMASSIALAGVAILLLPSPGQAAEPLAFTIPAEDGYGIAECMQAGNACGQAMATSWCEAHGHAHAAAYGMADDVTGWIEGVTPASARAASVVIRCDD